MIFPEMKNPTEVLIIAEEDLNDKLMVKISKEYDTWWMSPLKALLAWR